MISNFLWDNKPPKVKANVISTSYENGGLKSPIFSLKYKALRGFWIKQCLYDDNQLWKSFIFEQCSHTCKNIVSSGLTSRNLNSLPNFCKEIFYLAFELLHPQSNKILNLQNEHLTYNENLKSGGNLFSSDKLIDYRIRDILTPNGDIYSATHLSNKFNINIMTANSLVSCVPKLWKRRLKNELDMNETDSNIYFYIQDKKIIFNKVTSKLIYWHFISLISEPPSSIPKWNEKLQLNVSDERWSSCFSLLHQMSFNQYYQSK